MNNTQNISLGATRAKPIGQRGAVSVAAALSLTALMGAGAMAVDVGNVMVARNDIQNAVDAGALRGAGLLYTQGGTSPNFSMMTNNSGSPVYVSVNQNDAIGTHDTLTVNSNYWQSINSKAPSNEAAVQVSLTKQVKLFFGGIIGMSSMNVSASATAIVQNSSALGAGGTKLPIAIPQCAINQYWDSSNNQPKSDPIQVGPTHTCGGGNSNNQGDQNHQQQQQQHDGFNGLNSRHYVSLHGNPRNPMPHSTAFRAIRAQLVRSDFTVVAPQADSALRSHFHHTSFIRTDHQQNNDHQQNSGADQNGSANQQQGTGDGAGGPGNGSGPGNGAGQGLGSGGNSGSCVTGQFTTLTSHPDDGNFSHAESVTQNGNPQDLHSGDSISLQGNDYSPQGGQQQGGQGNGNQGDNQHHSLLETPHSLTSLVSYSVRSPAVMLSSSSSSSRALFLRVDGGQGQNGHNQGNGQDQGGGSQQGSGDPYTSINNCSAAGNHSCEYAIVPVVDQATSSNGSGTQTIVGFACMHVLSATDGTINATLSSGCISNTSAKASTSSGSSTQTAWGVVSPPRLAQ